MIQWRGIEHQLGDMFMRTDRNRTPEMCTPWQALAYAIWDVDEAAEVARGPLPLSAGVSLTWLAFSAEGLLTAMDSEGCAPLSSMDLRVCATLAASSACPQRCTGARHELQPSALMSQRQAYATGPEEWGLWRRALVRERRLAIGNS